MNDELYVVLCECVFWREHVMFCECMQRISCNVDECCACIHYAL